MPNEEVENPWSEYRRLVLAELGRLNDGLVAVSVKIDHMDAARAAEIAQLRTNDISKLQIDMALIKQKAAWIGFGVGTVTSSVVGTIVAFLLK